MVVHHGGCHCGAVQFEVEAPAELDVQLCNCSICSMTSYLHLIVPRSRFRLLSGDDSLSTYTFNTGVAQHHFCATCGIKSFYVPRSNPDGVSVNVRCLRPETIAKVRVTSFDGRNWELHAHELADLSVDVPE
jgi:hypothetical protein